MSGSRVVAVAAMVVACAAPAASAQTVYVIEHAKVVTVSGPTIDDGSVVIRNGRIADVGPTVTVPAGATVIDGRGLVVYPGLFDPDSNLGMAGSNPENLFGPLMPHLEASPAFIPDSEEIPIARQIGLTHVLVRPPRGMIPGQGEIMNLAGWTGEEMLVKPRAALFMAFPTVGDLHYTDDERFQVTPWSVAKPQYDRQVKQLTDFFASARAYLAAWEQQAHNAGWKRDVRLDAMIPVLRRQQVVIIEAATDVDIRHAVQFAARENLDFVIASQTGVWRVADFLKANQVRVLLESPFDYPHDFDDPQDSVYTTPAVLHEKGVPFAFSTLGDRLNRPRLFVQTAGIAVAHGLPPEAALRAMTLTAAEFLGVADALGSIDKGKIANLLVVRGDLFDAQAEVQYVFVAGEPASLRTVETALYEKYRDRPPAKPVVKKLQR